MKILKAGAAYFGLVFGAGFLLGCIRVPFLVPHLGARVAELLEMPVQFVVIVFAARYSHSTGRRICRPGLGDCRGVAVGAGLGGALGG